MHLPVLPLLATIATLATSHGASTLGRSGRRLRVAPPPPGLRCATEAAASYPSYWNDTALRICTHDANATTKVWRREKICIVGGGSAGVHLGWLLRRRGFNRTVLFERRERLGGDIWTRPGNVTRELGAAFLSPDYVEVRALLRRFGLPEEPVSVSKAMRFHHAIVAPDGSVTDTNETAADWYGSWLENITNVTDRAAQGRLVADALVRYDAVHSGIFGTYVGRFPPRPVSSAAAAEINCTGTVFLERHGLAELTPLMYQFFVMQGMGLLDFMSAYYMLKWCSPQSLRAGGFGNDRDTPLAMLPDGFGALVDGLARDVQLDVRLGANITAIRRSRAGGVWLHFDGTAQGMAPEACDIVALSGAIPRTVRTILDPPSAAEVEYFGDMRAMQFLVSLLDLEVGHGGGGGGGGGGGDVPAYKALEYWPDAFRVPAGVILRRDVGFAEQGRAHGVGGLQSFSYWNDPDVANRSTHWASQRRWVAARENLSIRRVLAQFFVDTYLFHHSVAGVSEDLRPWRLGELQLLEDARTLYVGGSASFETVEDVVHHNLALVDDLIDSAAAPRPFDDDAVEMLAFDLPCGEVQDFVAADRAAWSAYLEKQPGFGRKYVLQTHGGSGSAPGHAANCSLVSYVEWTSRSLWLSIPATQLAQVQQQFEADMRARGIDPAPQPTTLPAAAAGQGLVVQSRIFIGAAAAHLPASNKRRQPRRPEEEDRPPPRPQPAMEILRFDLPCADVDRFFLVDNATWTTFLTKQKGFVAKTQLFSPVPPPGPRDNCSVWSHVHWASRAAWQSIPAAELAAAQRDFVHAFGYAPPLTRGPGSGPGMGLGYDIRTVAADVPPRVLAVGGNDVVAYHTSLEPGAMDVPGLPQYRRLLDSSRVLNASLAALHPWSYEFWFASAANAALFDADPLAYIPAFGGHCTHGIASRNDLSVDLLVDGRMAFTCVNTTQWSVINGTLYMNSCGMYDDFIKDPAGDIAKARQRWTAWFGTAQHGPINDRCFQDGGRWGGNPVGALIPTRCVLD